MDSDTLIPAYLKLRAAIEGVAQRGQEGTPVSLAALALAEAEGVTGAASTIADALRATDRALARRQSWHSALNTPLRLVLAAILVRRGADADAFDDARLELRERFREGKLRRDECREAIAALLLGERPIPAAIGPEEVARMRAIYASLRLHRWFLTGPDDLPAIALLVDEPGEPAALADAIEAIYKRLRVLGLAPGDALQGLAVALYLGARRSWSERVAGLLEALRAHEQPIEPRSYPALGLLALISATPMAVATLAARLGDRMAAAIGVIDPEALILGAALALTIHLRASDDPAVARRILDLELLQHAYLIGIERAAV